MGAPSENALTQDVRAILFVDIVDSVGSMLADEAGAIARWLELQGAVIERVLPQHGGRMVKSTGDGLLLDFKTMREAIAAAFAIQDAAQQLGTGRTAADWLHLRMSGQIGNVVVGAHDVYGNAVNLAARLLTTLAVPGEVVLSAAARDQLTPSLDADIEDLGDCYLKGIKEPVRAYRARRPGATPLAPYLAPAGQILPAIAVIPFTARLTPPAHEVLGEVVADGIIRKLSRSQTLDVISRLSTTVFRGRVASVEEIGRSLACNYVLAGTFTTSGNAVTLDIELSEVRSRHVIWAERYADRIEGVTASETPLIDQVTADVTKAIATEELERARKSPLATLESYTLLLAAVALIHRSSARDFDRAREMLETVIEREPRQALPKAWLAYWHILRIQQGLGGDPLRDQYEAVTAAHAALDREPDNSLALAVDGLVHTHLTKRHDLAIESYEKATTVNPNDALAWLVKGTHLAFTGDGEQAVYDTQKALRLSPLDPQGYYFHSLAASAYLSNDQNELALKHATTSLKFNRLHTSTLRAKAVAEWRLGLHDTAKQTAAELLRLEPSFAVSSWLRRSPVAPYDFGHALAQTLRELGIPE